MSKEAGKSLHYLRPLIKIRLSKKCKDFEKECTFHDKEGGDGDLPEKPKEANEMIKLLNETQIQSCYPMKVFYLVRSRNSLVKHTLIGKFLRALLWIQRTSLVRRQKSRQS